MTATIDNNPPTALGDSPSVPIVVVSTYAYSSGQAAFGDVSVQEVDILYSSDEAEATSVYRNVIARFQGIYGGLGIEPDYSSNTGPYHCAYFSKDEITISVEKF